MKYKLVCVLWMLSGLGFSQINCKVFDRVLGPFFHYQYDTKDHIKGAHTDSAGIGGKCTYTPGYGPCDCVSETDAATPGYPDVGTTTSGRYHIGGAATKSGVSTGLKGNGAASDAESAVVFDSCVEPTCTTKISISGKGDGTGFTVTDDPVAIWHDEFYYRNPCPGETGDSGCIVVKKQEYDRPGYKPPRNVCGPSPLIIDTVGAPHDFSATVLFPLQPGNPQLIHWPTAASKWMWLVMPDHGKVTSGRQMLGEFSPQPDFSNPNPNGFLALQEYDLPKHKGNGNNTIDPNDKIWNKLRLWGDEHCLLHPGKLCDGARPSELHKLSEFGIHSVSLLYNMQRDFDEYGDNFELYSFINVLQPTSTNKASLQESTDHLHRKVVDVYLGFAKN